MMRIPRIATDESRILAAIDAFMPVTSHNSWALSREHGSGSYMKIGRMNVLRADWDRILKEHAIVMAVHYKEATKGARIKIFDYRLIKSRFGETKVVRGLLGYVRHCDNAEARRFYDAQQAASVAAIVASVDAGDLDEAKDTKRQFKARGQYM